MDISKPVISSVLPEQWDYDILEDGRIVYFQLGKPAGDKSPFQWIPPSESWKHFNQIIHGELTESSRRVAIVTNPERVFLNNKNIHLHR